MTIFADIVMVCWPLVVLGLFTRLQPMKAAVVAFLVGWLFLPFKSYPVSGLPDITKMSLTCYTIFVATLVFDAQRILSFRPRLFDVVAACVCIAPAISSLTNGLGLYDAFSGFVAASTTYGLPYFLGRIYLNSALALNFAALALVTATLVYLPLCWFEMRMSPQLHALVYGESHRGAGGATIRLGGYRPAVFLDSGLQLGMWMTTASVLGAWLWWTGVWRRTWRTNAGWWLLVLLGTTILCRSTGALLLLILGLGALALLKIARTRLGLLLLLLIAPTYIVVRSVGAAAWQPTVELAMHLDADRAQSLQYRFENEDLLSKKAMNRPWFGWGGWGRNRVYDDRGRDLTVTDGKWIIEFGKHGLFGLMSYFTLLLLPLALLMYRYPRRQLVSPPMAPILALSVAVVLFAIDCLPNSMTNPIYFAVAGGVLGAIGERTLSVSDRVSRGVSAAPFSGQQAAVLPRQLSARLDDRTD